MAELLVGKALLSAVFKVLFDKMASREVINFLNSRKRTEKLVEELKTTMNSVEGVLDDAEEQQITKPAVKTWLGDLRDAFYQADDSLDEIAYEALRLKLETHFQATKRRGKKVLSSLNPLKIGMDAKLEEILKKLKYLVEQKDTLGLRVGVGGQTWLLSQRKNPTTSLLDKPGVYGRDADKAAIMKLVLQDSNSVDVIRIVGMGGIGKTTLAQFVYGDSRVKDRFPLKSWVCISSQILDEFNGCKVTKHIIKEFDNSVNCDNMTANQLHDQLKYIVQKERFFLVLDDVWPDKDELFDFLWKPLQFGEAGSKIVVTTRNEWRRPAIMHRLRTHDLRALKEDACWSLFVKHAFDDENSAVPADLAVIGREIVKKCKGLPLAIKVLGGILSSKRNAKEWEMILENKMWKVQSDVGREILPALQLSYYYLPPHLKQCFAFCAIFPHDYSFQKEELVLLWMAEGLIHQSQEDDIKQVGEEYFDSLVSMSFFQLSSSSSCNFVMHDLISDLAKSVSGEFCCRLEADCQVHITGRIRHLSFIKTKLDASEKLEAIASPAFLHTFLLIDVLGWWEQQNINKVLLDLLPKLSCLRTLSLPRYCHISLVPDSIGHLKHLRYLNLEGALIENLPDHITSLYFLQTLILSRCKNLIKLPVCMAKLINLCHLDITGTKLQEMPQHMGKLTRLQCLTDFFLGNNSGSNIKELGRLKHLHGGLRIRNLQHAENAADALEANLEGKKLQKLGLIWNGDTKGSEHERAVLGQLQPHKNLEVLTIDGYGGTTFPDWIGEPSFSNVVTLKLFRCKYCSTLPPIGQLSSLKYLKIGYFEAVEVIGPEFYGSSTSMKKPFGSLEILWFKGLPEWKEWKQLNNSEDEDESRVFPHLRKLYIEECPKLTETLPGHLPSLENLEIKGSPLQLLCSIPRGGDPTLKCIIGVESGFEVAFGANTFQSMLAPRHGTRFEVGFGANGFQPMSMCRDWASVLKSSHALLRFSTSTSHCIDFVIKAMGQISYSSTIGEINITYCGGLECLQLELFPNLIALHLISCRDLKFISACESLTSLTYLKVSHCPNLISFPEGGLSVPNLKTLSILRLLNPKSRSSISNIS